MRDWASLQNNNDSLYIASHDGFSNFFISFKRDYFVFGKQWNYFLLFLAQKKKQKDIHPSKLDFVDFCRDSAMSKRACIALAAPSVPLYWKDVTENRGNRRFIRILVWLSSLCPCGVSHDLLSTGAWRLPHHRSASVHYKLLRALHHSCLFL